MISALNIYLAGLGVFECKHVETIIEHIKKSRRAVNTELAGQWKEPGTQTEFTLMWGSSIVIFKKH